MDGITMVEENLDSADTSDSQADVLLTSRRCVFCGDKIGFSCDCICVRAFYCSEQCLVLDQPVHRHLCGRIVHFGDSQRPSENHVRILLFAHDSPHPQFSWLRWASISGGICVNFDELRSDLDAMESDSLHEALSAAGIDANGHELECYSQSIDGLPIRGLPINQSVLGLGEQGHMGLPFGTQVVLRRDLANGRGNSSLRDVDYRNLRLACQYYQFSTLKLPVPFRHHHGQTTLRALLVHCDGSLAQLGHLWSKESYSAGLCPLGIG
jgi:hypothetical protein